MAERGPFTPSAHINLLCHTHPGTQPPGPSVLFGEKEQGFNSPSRPFPLQGIWAPWPWPLCQRLFLSLPLPLGGGNVGCELSKAQAPAHQDKRAHASDAATCWSPEGQHEERWSSLPGVGHRKALALDDSSFFLFPELYLTYSSICHLVCNVSHPILWMRKLISKKEQNDL